MPEDEQHAQRESSSFWWTVWQWLLRAGCAILLLVTILPLFKSGEWFVRVWDFPRAQIALLLVIAIVAICFQLRFRNGRLESIVWGTLLTGAIVWQTSHILPFTPVWRTEVEDASEGETTFRTMVLNLKFENHDFDAAVSQIRASKADVLVLIEVNEEWAKGLAILRDDYPYQHEEVRGDGLGLALWSKLPMRDAETRFIIEDRRPSIWSTLIVDDRPINFVAVHPTPPGLRDSTGKERRDSRVRDAELVAIAREIGDRKNEDWIVAGDFNDVGWSHTTRLFKRLSGLKDPRIGRTYMGTFHSRNPAIRFPIDHVFMSDGLQVAELSRKYIPGSDHFAVVISAAFDHSESGVDPDPEKDDQQEAAEILDEGKEDAAKRGVKTDSEVVD